MSSPPAVVAPSPPRNGGHQQHGAAAVAAVATDWASFSRSQIPATFSPLNGGGGGGGAIAPSLPPKSHANPNPNPINPQPVLQPMQPKTAAAAVNNKTSASPAKSINQSNADKYAALAELDEILNSASPSASKPVLPDPQTFLATSPKQGFGRGVAWGVAAPVQSVPQPQQSGGFWSDSFTQPQTNFYSGMDPSNVWAQMPAATVYHSGATVVQRDMGGGTATNPFLTEPAYPTQHPGARPLPGSFNTNPFL